ncbi:agamous-like MADS-box protein AGL62 [Lotus japonicus]|uniref:agamous-like MADS-box protein AGL62 n=1 Tax=Lotus japonicus TaxID=34305 RepID=UPI002585110F|nr:agamous-like MADS-box protein AGL62 [Lotus japonicus]
MSVVGTSGKKTRGRQKIEMKRITNESHLQVTFSKRRTGLFKKASELCTLCGAELALIVFSPGGKAFSFGHPSMEAVIQRYVSHAPYQTSSTMWYIEAQRRTNVLELNAQLTHINNQLESHKKHGEELNRLCKTTQAQFWSASQVEEMDKSQLEKFREALDELKKRVTSYGATAATTPPTHPFFTVASGSANAMVPIHHPLLPPPQVFPQQFFQGPMLHAHNLFGFNNMGGYGGTHRFF